MKTLILGTVLATIITWWVIVRFFSYVRIRSSLVEVHPFKNMVTIHSQSTGRLHIGGTQAGTFNIPPLGWQLFIVSNGTSHVRTYPEVLSHKMGPEDPRAIIANGNVFILFNEGKMSDGIYRMHIANVNDIAGTKRLIDISDIKLQTSEKNWTPWVIEGKVYISYMLAPKHRVYEVDPFTGKAVFVIETFFHSPVSLRGGTRAVYYAPTNTMIGFGHTIIKTPLRRYLSVCFEFEPVYPFAMKRIGRPFCFERMPWCEFACGLRVVGNTFLINYGVNDTRSHVSKVNYSDIPW